MIIMYCPVSDFCSFQRFTLMTKILWMSICNIHLCFNWNVFFFFFLLLCRNGTSHSMVLGRRRYFNPLHMETRWGGDWENSAVEGLRWTWSIIEAKSIWPNYKSMRWVLKPWINTLIFIFSHKNLFQIDDDLRLDSLVNK